MESMGRSPQQHRDGKDAGYGGVGYGDPYYLDAGGANGVHRTVDVVRG